MPDKYIYRREDNGTLIEVEFSVMLTQEDGYIRLSDGVLARRCVSLERDGEPLEHKGGASAVAPRIVSDALGCAAHQVEELREHARREGHRVSFQVDPTCEHYYQAHFNTYDEKWRYAKSRGLSDQNSTNGSKVTLSPEQLERAKQRLLETAGG